MMCRGASIKKEIRQPLCHDGFMTDQKNNIEQAKIWGLFFVLIGILAVVVPKKMAKNDPKKEAYEYCVKQFPKRRLHGDRFSMNLGELAREKCMELKGY